MSIPEALHVSSEYLKVAMQHLLAVGYLLKSSGTTVPPWRLKSGTLLIVSLWGPEAIFKAVTSAVLWRLCSGKFEDGEEIAVEKVVVI